MDTVIIKEQFLTIKDGNIFVKIWEPKKTDKSSVPPLFLLHDSLGCVETWKNFPELLCKKTKTTVIAYDRLGFGRSTARTKLPSFDFMKEEAQIYFPLVRSLLEVHEFTVMGHSVGGCMALLSAIDQPDNKAVISESAPVINEEITILGLKKAQAFFKNPAKIEKLKRYHGEKAEWVVRSWIDLWLAPEFAQWSLQNDLAKITTPVLTLFGDRDEYGSLALPKLVYKSVLGPSSLKIFNNIGHFPHRDIEHDVLNCVSNFLNLIFKQ